MRSSYINQILFAAALLIAQKSFAAYLCNDLLEGKKRKNMGKIIAAEPQAMGSIYRDQNMLAPGSALATSSGNLIQQGIRMIVHAASGSMGKGGLGFDPTLKSIAESLANSIKLAKANGAKSVAIPFIGGGIFASRIGVDNSKIAETLLGTAAQNSQLLKLKFVIFGEKDLSLFTNTAAAMKIQNIEILEGSITDFSVHGSEAIINAANTEVIFGGGLSGLIGRATGESNSINEEAAAAIRSFYGF